MRKYTAGILPTIVVPSIIVCICAASSSAYVWGGTQNRTESAALETVNKVDKAEESTFENTELKQSKATTQSADKPVMRQISRDQLLIITSLLNRIILHSL